MTERIHVNLSVEQASALVDAITCIQLAADGNVNALTQAFMPGPGSVDDSPEGDDYRHVVADLAHEVYAMLKPEIESARARDVGLQDFLHRVKMQRKYYNLDADEDPREP